MHHSQYAAKLVCKHCGQGNRSGRWPINGDGTPLYYQTEPGRHTVTVHCDHCAKDWYVVWDQDPGPVRQLDSVDEPLGASNVYVENRFELSSGGVRIPSGTQGVVKKSFPGGMVIVSFPGLGVEGSWTDDVFTPVTPSTEARAASKRTSRRKAGRKAGTKPPSAKRQSTDAAHTPQKAERRRPAKRVQIGIGYFLIVLDMFALSTGVLEGDPQIGTAAVGLMILLGGPGALLIYFGLRTRALQRMSDGEIVEQPYMLWMLPGYIALIVSAAVGAGWLWGLAAGIVGFGLMFLFATLEDRRDEIRAFLDTPVGQHTVDDQLRRTGSGSIALLTLTRDINGLRRAFSLAADWQDRESVVVALSVLCKQLRDERSNRSAEMVLALTELLALCEAERSGGAVRERCIEQLETLTGLMLGDALSPRE